MQLGFLEFQKIIQLNNRWLKNILRLNAVKINLGFVTPPSNNLFMASFTDGDIPCFDFGSVCK